MEKATQTPIMIYTEQTPNPESLKFVTNRMLYANLRADFRERTLADEWSPLASELFNFPFVKGVYISNNFVSITKEPNYPWPEIMIDVKEFIKTYLNEDKTVIKDGFEAVLEKIEADRVKDYDGNDAEIVKKITEIIDTYVKPAVEMDGGNIEFRSFEQGVVTVVLQGACSGCPSSTVTLKSGIEGMMKRMVPEVTEVVAEMG